MADTLGAQPKQRDITPPGKRPEYRDHVKDADQKKAEPRKKGDSVLYVRHRFADKLQMTVAAVRKGSDGQREYQLYKGTTKELFSTSNGDWFSGDVLETPKK